MLKLNIVGKFFDNHSLSIINRNIALGLSKKVDVKIISLDAPSVEYKVDHNQVNKLLELRGAHNDADVEIRHSYPPMWRHPSNDKTKLVYIQPWEFSSVPFEWQYKFETFSDSLVSLSKFSEDSFLTAGLNPKDSFVIPCGYNPSVFNTDNRTSSNITRFLFVGCGQYRKGLDLLLAYWARNTKKYESIQLTIKDTPQVYGQSSLLQDIIKLQYVTKCANIIYDDTVRSESEMADLYKSTDILVHPYRGEGFGMHIQEAMACGVVPVVTAGGSTDDFVIDNKVASNRKIVNMNDIFAAKPGDSMTLMGSHRYVIEPDLTSLTNTINTVKNTYKDIKVNTSKLSTWDEVTEAYFKLVTRMSEIQKPKRVR